jgi:hypothetical protein
MAWTVKYCQPFGACFFDSRVLTNPRLTVEASLHFASADGWLMCALTVWRPVHQLRNRRVMLMAQHKRTRLSAITRGPID